MTEEQIELTPKMKITSDEFLMICRGAYKTTPGYEKYYKMYGSAIQCVQINETQVTGEIHFSQFEFNWALVFKACQFDNIILFIDAIFQKRVSITNCTFNSSVSFIEPMFNNTIDIANCITNHDILLDGGKYNRTFNIGIKGTEKREAHRMYRLPAITVLGGEFNNLNIGKHNNTHLKVLAVQAIGVTGNVFITNKKTIIENLYVSNLSRHLMLFLEDININQLSISSFTSSVKFKIHNIKPLKIGEERTEFKIQNSNLGTAEINSLDLTNFEIVNIRDSHISDVNFVNTKWPTTITSYEQSGSKVITEIEPINYYFKNRDTYRQLKYASSKYGDIVTSYEFLAKEMEAYRKQLKYELTNERKDWWNNKSERINLWLNMFSNYYGNNWLKAVGWTLLFNSILFTFYCWAQGYRIGVDWETFWTLTAYSFEFLNPLRKADFLEHITGKHPRAGAIAIDYISRIIIAYFVYQTISAFRKFGKRSA